jgi:hypothetical protein
MTLSAYERNLLLNSKVRECRVKLWLFDEPATSLVTAYPTASVDLTLSGQAYPLMLVSPGHAIVAPGESVTLYAGDSIYWITVPTPIPAGSMTWSLVSGSAIVSPSGNTCVVTPIGGEDSEVVVRVTGTQSGASNYRDVRIACSTNGWAKPTGTIEISGSYSQRGWSGTVQVAGDSVSDLETGKWLLIHVDTYYDGVKYTIGGYRRPETLAVLAVDRWEYSEDTEGHTICTIHVHSPAEWLNSFKGYCIANETGDERYLLFKATAGASTTVYGAAAASVMTYAYFIASRSALSRHFNVTIWDDEESYGNFIVNIGGLFDMLASCAESVLGVAMCDAFGSISLIPHPAVRADEWWGTPDPIWDSAAPLTRDYCTATIQYYPDYHPSGRSWDGLIYRAYSQEGTALAFSAGTLGTGKLVNEDYNGYAVDSNANNRLIWASDLLSYINRTWDFEAEFYCIGNTLNVGSFVYTNLDPTQGGQPVVNGLAYIHRVSHRFDIARRMQWTTVGASKLTGSIA